MRSAHQCTDGQRIADWITRYPGTRLVWTRSRYGISWWLVDDRSGRWFGVEE